MNQAVQELGRVFKDLGIGILGGSIVAYAAVSAAYWYFAGVGIVVYSFGLALQLLTK